MSAVCVLTPIVIAAWPSFSAAVVAAATSLGYTLVQETEVSRTPEKISEKPPLALEIPRSEVVTDSLGRDRKIQVTRDGVTVTFSRNARGRAAVCVSGEGLKEEQLRASGEELSQRVVQQFVYQRLMDEIRARNFVVVEEQQDQTQAIRLKIWHWEN